MKFINLLMGCILAFSCSSYAGVIVGGTRLVYDGSNKESSISVKNPEDSTPYLIQSWVDDAGPNDDNKNANKPPFIVTPPLFRLDAGLENTLRVVKLKGTELLPKDRESIFWLDIKSIPAERKNAEGKVTQNRLQISVKTRIKLFYRPQGLSDTVAEAAAKISFKKTGGKLTVINPTPYYFTFNMLKIGGLSVEPYSNMVSPKSEQQYKLKGNGGTVEWNYINDFGGISKTFVTPVK